jgi:RNA polymerase sigma-32 factor
VELLQDAEESPEETTHRRRRDGAVRGVLGRLYQQLDERERAVLEQRLLSDDGEVTLADLGKDFALSRERLRQIEARLKSRLKKALLAEGRVLH